MIRRFKLKSGLSFVVLMFGLSGWANSACNFDADTNSLGVQEDSGQGNYDCTVLTSLDPETGEPVPMVNLDDGGITGGWSLNNDGTIKWYVNDVDTNDDSLLDSRNNVYLVSTFNKGQGKRCNYLYEAGVADGDGLGAMNSGDVETVTICGDLKAVPIAAEDDIITTVGDACSTEITVPQTGGDVIIEPAVSIGFTAASLEAELSSDQIAVCGLSTEASELLGLDQVQCDPEPPPVNVPADDCSVELDGSYDLSCAPVVAVKPNPEDLKYCWYYENRVCEEVTDTTTGYCAGRYSDTYIPKTKKGTFDVSIDVHDGSTCYTYYLRGRAYYHCY